MHQGQRHRATEPDPAPAPVTIATFPFSSVLIVCSIGRGQHRPVAVRSGAPGGFPAATPNGGQTLRQRCTRRLLHVYWVCRQPQPSLTCRWDRLLSSPLYWSRALGRTVLAAGVGAAGVGNFGSVTSRRCRWQSDDGRWSLRCRRREPDWSGAGMHSPRRESPCGLVRSHTSPGGLTGLRRMIRPQTPTSISVSRGKPRRARLPGGSGVSALPEITTQTVALTRSGGEIDHAAR